MLDEILKRLIDENLRNKYRFLWIIDELGITQGRINHIYPNLSIHFYDNPIDFRLFYEPLREKMEEEEPANAVVISYKKEDIPPDVRRYCPNPLYLRPSILFSALHPIIDDLLLEGEFVERLAIFYDGINRGREETIRFVLQNLLEIPPLPPTLSLKDAFNLLQAYHLRGRGIPTGFLKPYLVSLQNLGYSLEKLLVNSEYFEELLKQVLLAWIEKRAGIELPGVDEVARKLLSSDIGLERNRLLEEAWKRINWKEIAKAIPPHSVQTLISPLLPQEFYECLSEDVRQQLCRNWRDEALLKSAETLRKERKASEKLGSVLDLANFLREFSLPAEEPLKRALRWQEIARNIAFQWRNISGVDGGSALRKEWEKLLERANEEFVKFVLQNYPRWIKAKPRPILSCDVLSEAVLPNLRRDVPVYLLVVDGMTYAQWAMMEDEVRGEMRDYKFEDRKCFSILPSATTYSRNAIFAGELPREIGKSYGEGYLTSNEGEEQMLRDWLKRNKLGNKSLIYCKWREDWGRALKEKADLKAFILNFTDEITHITGKVAESEEELLALVRTAYHFRPFSDLFSAVKEDGAVLVITSDHGSIWVRETFQIPTMEHARSLGRSSRYYRLSDHLNETERKFINLVKMWSVQYLSRDVSEDWGLPKGNYLFAYGNFMFSERKQIVSMAVHGGISLWEMCVPLVVLSPKI
ncbi:PglZ domain-containing protein [bacterium]|nr:PglZ domain-containing protein [bacterium]